MNIGVVIPAGPGREDNLREVLTALELQAPVRPKGVVVCDGFDFPTSYKAPFLHRFEFVTTPKHEPGMEQPRNLGVRALRKLMPDVTHVWFLDSDVMVEPDVLAWIKLAYERGPDVPRIMVCPYDWLRPGYRPDPGWLTEWVERAIQMEDPRWVSFKQYESDELREEDLAAGLACFSGNLVWPVDEFQRVGGFWNELHHGRCEDGELGIRAVAMGVPISFCRAARGLHLWHDFDVGVTKQRNARDVPMLDDRHPWLQGRGVFMVDRDGKAFDVRCPECEQQVRTIEWWEHAEKCGAGLAL